MDDKSASCYNGFAGPFWGLDNSYLSAIVSTYYQEYFRLFVSRYDAKLTGSAQGLVELINHAATRLTTFETAWHFACAGIREAVANNVSDDDALDAAVSLAFHALASGVSSEFHASSERNFRPMWRGCLIQPTKSIHVWRRGSKAAIAKDGSVTSLPPDSCVEGHNCLPTIGSENIHLTLLSQEAANRIGCPTPPSLAPNDILLATQNVSAALDILERHAPIFARWVGRVMAFIVPADGPHGLMQSSSSRQWPGVAVISFRCDAVAIAEMLVHEATHQYFNILLMIDPVTDGTDGRLYYSPMRKCERPIEMILLAYHAFANVLMFYRECRRSGLMDAGYCERNEQELVPDLRKLEDALMKTNSLTEVGEALWRPFRPHVAQPV
ncbi:hypothetical protein LB565_18705 [Mesorhizobium sp. CA14]|uniref:aKG-HExxH-type peptide beta-hydroxylase n=1 Tax=Mesorhizobium sp. CA14 TaxID=2876642 RepID=UPI001CCF8C27|nr:HEXXH motif-containing putative peptide modification protein [Mesorhizobium sp. CA14]MBZ9850017.1 hypothetical protein [Mesorhizobium sp. CA14]